MFLRKEVRKSRHFRHSITNNNNRVAWGADASGPGRLGPFWPLVFTPFEHRTMLISIECECNLAILQMSHDETLNSDA